MDTYAKSLMPMYFYVGRVLNHYARDWPRRASLSAFEKAFKSSTVSVTPVYQSCSNGAGVISRNSRRVVN